MTKPLIASAVLAAILSLGVSMPAEARAPLGFQLMCLKNPASCRGGGAASIAATADLINILGQVNRRVNASIIPRNDTGADTWSLSTRTGDCEDFVLAKRQQLLAMDFPSSALRIAYVKTRRGEDHAVLVVKTNEGNLTLDNLTSGIKHLNETGYRVISMSGANPRNWS